MSMNTIKCIELLKQAIVQVTINTYVEQGQAGADEVFKLLEQVEGEIETGECGENQKTTEAPKKTNFDKITESVESLAEFLAPRIICADCPYWKNRNCVASLPCEEALKEWLQKECE